MLLHEELIKSFIGLSEEKKKESQQNDEQIKKRKSWLSKGTALATEEMKFLELDGLMYYLSDRDLKGQRLRLTFW